MLFSFLSVVTVVFNPLQPGRPGCSSSACRGRRLGGGPVLHGPDHEPGRSQAADAAHRPAGRRDPESGPGPGRAPAGALQVERGRVDPALL